MSIRDEEIARMTKYANGLGIKVVFIRDARRSQKVSDYAQWTNDPPEILIYVPKHKSKTEIIMTFLHELGHNFYWVHNNKPEIPDAYLLEENRKRTDPPIPKNKRKQILDYERAGISYMKIIATELDLKVPMWKVELHQEHDLWVYEYYYEHGRYPSKKESRTKFQELKTKHEGSR